VIRRPGDDLHHFDSMLLPDGVISPVALRVSDVRQSSRGHNCSLPDLCGEPSHNDDGFLSVQSFLWCYGGVGMAVSSFPAGWYLDSQDAGLVRWWDGVQWTVNTQPARQPAQPSNSIASGAIAQLGSTRHGRPGRKRHLQAEVDRLRQVVDAMGITEQQQVQTEIVRLQQELSGCGLSRQSYPASWSRP
jgi:Protein of unknown function (DUF2510)